MGYFTRGLEVRIVGRRVQQIAQGQVAHAGRRQLQQPAQRIAIQLRLPGHDHPFLPGAALHSATVAASICATAASGIDVRALIAAASNPSAANRRATASIGSPTSTMCPSGSVDAQRALGPRLLVDGMHQPHARRLKRLLGGLQIVHLEVKLQILPTEGGWVLRRPVVDHLAGMPGFPQGQSALECHVLPEVHLDLLAEQILVKMAGRRPYP